MDDGSDGSHGILRAESKLFLANAFAAVCTTGIALDHLASFVRQRT